MILDILFIRYIKNKFRVSGKILKLENLESSENMKPTHLQILVVRLLAEIGNFNTLQVKHSYLFIYLFIRHTQITIQFDNMID